MIGTKERMLKAAGEAAGNIGSRVGPCRRGKKNRNEKDEWDTPGHGLVSLLTKAICQRRQKGQPNLQKTGNSRGIGTTKGQNGDSVCLRKNIVGATAGTNAYQGTVEGTLLADAQGERTTRGSAILLFIAGVSCFAVMDGLGKFLAADFPLLQLVWARNAFAIPVILATTAPAGWLRLLRQFSKKLSC
jgi:hypothetical protein